MSPFRRGPSLRQFIVSYAPDWLILYHIPRHVTGFKRHFSLTDFSLRHPYAVQQRVSTNALWILSVALPLAVQSVNVLFIRSWWDLHHSTLGHTSFSSLFIYLFHMTGSVVVHHHHRVRHTTHQGHRGSSDLIERCQPLPGSEDPLLGLSTNYIPWSPASSTT
ncbi:hypothetical protein L210DRAFT_904639 [Boletus edulis BED1]|uniref:Fatty acid desaturase domain-containing protein n=1 Tax=Boletus edulis BED1 TaxID=1328754 RepID=A0AAD4C7N4_BOLED|nr:hypothetical protein L210DRAFT_904639 [Boletus edulis BED1]